MRRTLSGSPTSPSDGQWCNEPGLPGQSTDFEYDHGVVYQEALQGKRDTLKCDIIIGGLLIFHL